MIVLDSDIIMDALKGRPTAMAFLARLEASGEPIAATSINAGEVLRGAVATDNPVQSVAAARQALARLVQLPYGPRAAERFGSLMAGLDRAGRRMPEVDAMVAVLALDNGGRIATRNVRHFARVAGLEVLTPDSAAS